jgi:HTH-like domain
VTILCRCLEVSASGFYAWRARPESTRAREDRRLKVLVHASFTGGRGYYGSPRVHDDLSAWHERVSRKRLIRLMQEDGLRARVRKRYKGTTMSEHHQPIAANLLQQDFAAARPNQRWVGDTSELRIGDPSVDGSKPAIYRQGKTVIFSGLIETREFYCETGSGRKSVCTLVRQLRGPHLSTWAWCKSRSSSAVTAAVSPRSLPQSSTGRFDVSSVDARS